MFKTSLTLSNGLEMPVLGLGTSLRGKARIESDAFVESVKHAIDKGYRHIDTVNKSIFLFLLLFGFAFYCLFERK